MKFYPNFHVICLPAILCQGHNPLSTYDWKTKKFIATIILWTYVNRTKWTLVSINIQEVEGMAWVNSLHFVTLLKWFPREMQKWRLTIKRLQKFHTDDVSLPRSGQVLLIGRAAREIVLQPIRCTPQTRVVTRHHYGISACVPQTSFGGKQPWWRREMSVLFSGYRRNSTRLDLGWLSIPVLCSLLQ